MMNVGENVTLTVKNPLWDRRSIYGYAVAEFETYTGTVVPNPIWVGADQLCLSTGTVQFPFRVLDRDRIVGLSEAVGQSESKVFNIVGAKGKSYVVTVENGRWGCNCVGFGYRRSCSHVVEAKSKVNGSMATVETEKKIASTENKCCFNSKSAVQSNSRKNETGASRLNPKLEKVKMAKLTKTAVVTAIMVKHSDRPMVEVCNIIETQLPCKEGYGKVWYRWAVKEGVAPGVLATTAKVPADRKDKAKKKTVTRMAKELLAKTKNSVEKKAKVAELEKSSSEIEKIKEANLARMKAVTARVKKVREYGPGRTAAQGEATPDDFDPQLAREEVAAMIAEIDRNRSAYVGPKFLED